MRDIDCISASKPALLSVFSPGLFRFSLACIVFAQHSTRLMIGAAAVFLFFSLSGYWIAVIWDKDYAVTRLPALTFYISRAWRLLPAFWVANGIAISIATTNGALPAEYRSLGSSLHSIVMLIGNVCLLGYASLPHTQRLLDTAWSLDVEVEFYLLLPLLMMLSPRWRIQASFIAGLLGLCAIVIYGEPVHRNLGYYLFFFTMGLYVHHARLAPTRALALLGLSIASGLMFMCFVVPELRGLVLSSTHAAGDSVRWNYSANCLIAFLMTPFAFYTVSQPSVGYDRMLGDLSYLVYLFHVPALALLSASYYEETFARRLPLLLLVWTGVFAASFLFWVFLHRPLEQQRRRFTSRRKFPSSLHAGDRVEN